MKDMQTQVKKIRSDAAECLMLSNLVTEERRHLFAKIADHLNSLALEIETDTAISIAAAPTAAGHRQQAPRSWRKLSWLLLIAVMAMAGALFWALNRTEMQRFSSANLPLKTEPASPDSSQQLAALLFDETNQRKVISDQLSALNARLDGLAKQLDDLKSFQTIVSASSIKATAGQEGGSLGTEAKPLAAEERDSRTVTGSNSSSNSSIAPEATASVSPTTIGAAGEPTDQVGTIPPNRVELDARRTTIGPTGCMHFRSFDPVSGTYMTFDGRRRPCR